MTRALPGLRVVVAGRVPAVPAVAAVAAVEADADGAGEAGVGGAAGSVAIRASDSARATGSSRTSFPSTASRRS